MTFSRFCTALCMSLLLFCTLAAPTNAIYEQQSERELLLFWKDGQIWGNGRHQPYAQLKLYDEGNNLLWQGSSDVRGSFEFLLDKGALSPAEDHHLTLHAFDQFGREIQNDAKKPDTLERLLPAVSQKDEHLTTTSVPEKEAPPAVSPTSSSATQTIATAAEGQGGMFWEILLGFAVIGGIGFGGFFFWKKRQENLE